jgi:uncharacterized protein (TIGR00730 family)
MNSICVYCGSSAGADERYAGAAATLGEALVDQGITLVFGGGNIGLMGIIADTVIDNGGKAIGVIPRFLLEKDLSHSSLTELVVVETMHERKKQMFDRADGFIAMPGGFGTIEEIFEMITWGQLQLHGKPCAFYNVNGYYDEISRFILKSISEGFISGIFRDLILFSDNPRRIIEFFRGYQHPDFDKIAYAQQR